jgi:hypothetical protein
MPPTEGAVYVEFSGIYRKIALCTRSELWVKGILWARYTGVPITNPSDTVPIKWFAYCTVDTQVLSIHQVIINLPRKVSFSLRLLRLSGLHIILFIDVSYDMLAVLTLNHNPWSKYKISSLYHPSFVSFPLDLQCPRTDV